MTRAIVVACGEPLIRGAVEEFERAELAGLDIERVLVPGGPWWVAQAARASSGWLKRVIADRSSVVEAVTEHLRAPGLARVALLAHQDCEWYRRREPGASAGELVRLAGADLYAARDEVLRLAGRQMVVSGHVFVRDASTFPTARSLF